MKRWYLILAGTLLVISLIAGCSGPFASSGIPQNTPGTQGSGSTQGMVGHAGVPIASPTPQVTPARRAVLNLFDTTRFHWFDYVYSYGSGFFHVKKEYLSGDYQGQPVTVIQWTKTIHHTPDGPALDPVLVTKLYIDATGKQVGGVSMQIMDGHESDGPSAVDPSLDYLMAVNPDSAAISPAPVTLSVHAGTFTCSRYDLQDNDWHVRTVYTTPDVPVPVKVNDAELYAWG